jgi:hypothetical protein
MGWEKRERGGLYYTRSRRVAGQVEREYVGAGEIADLAAEVDSAEREARYTQRANLRKLERSMDALDKAVNEFIWHTEALTKASFIVAGFRRHNRGEWRKRREQ